ncbi:uncharacterized protein EAE97_002537 [Botrytis byssoidea]|uniref:DASH complex subunit DUO1 n=1 Tax=Botrytis byssoidea TaxID=139641 RepID=A0A9P5IUT6_9HELO|nr:uncharacterized protein EAE97_002537 [Botrytis byssoidea]KAF7950985.1 hypothetical protein EAE97_002537 [Botrytis byssoidea]
MATPDIGKLDLSDSDNEDLFASPSKLSKADLKALSKSSEGNAPAQRSGGSKYDAETAREAALQKELEGVRNINELIEGVLGSLDLAKGNMDTVSQTVTSASMLLNTWIRILSQTEHNQRLILNPNWRGASQDVADMENEQVLKAQAAERRAAEEERRREAARQRAEDEERQRQAGTTSRGTRGGRGRARGGVLRPGSISSSGYGRGSSTGSSTGTGTSRGGSGIGRGIPRGRARGVR